MLELDGSAGGGQLLRTALTLSAITGQPFRMEHVRGDRPEPGLKSQHLVAVELLADICDAEVSDVAVGTDEVTFEPGPVDPGRYEVDVGTAGSVTLVFDAVLPLALADAGPISVTATGGTDVKWSPPMDFHRRVKLPLLRAWGLHGVLDRHRVGFYPAGGGRATLYLAPSDPGPLELVERGDLLGVRVYSTAAEDLRDADVADRQAAAAVEGLDPTEVPVTERTTTYVESDSPGSALVVVLDFEGTTAGFTALGERGLPSEDVGEAAAEAALDFWQGAGQGSAVDPHLADQVVPLLALAGGQVTIPEVTDHVASAVDLVDAFGFEVAVVPHGDEAVLVGR
jgi:RNA 3'-terminal phosphate cyclase (ATP)